MKKPAKGKKPSSKNFYILILILVIVLLTGVSIGFKSLLDSSTKIPSLTSSQKLPFNQPVVAVENSAKPSSIASPIPVIQQIPPNSGRSIQVPVLYYHYIGNNPNPADKLRDNLSVSPDKFEEQMKYLAEHGYNTTSYDTLYAALKGNGTLPPKPIILTFDDGYIDFYINAFPILRRFNFHATVFVATALMDQGYYLHWNQIKEIDATGLVSFQAHTVHHPNLTLLTHDQMVGEITTSKRVLEQQLGKPVNFFAYPYGVSNSSTWNEVQKAGFIGATGTWGGNIDSEGNIYNMPRIKVSGAWSIQEFGARL